MSAAYRLFGAETSAYSTKLRSYMRYKGLEHEWLVRTVETESALQEAARFATLPVLVTASGYAVHDTTPTIEALEADSPAPEIIPEDPSCAFLAAVLEDYADLWLSKAVMQYRWGRKKDQKEAAARAIDEYYVSGAPENRKELEKASIERMTDEFARMGLDKEMGGVVEKSFKRFIKLLNTHLEKHLYIFGGCPSIADFGISAQISQMLKDPTPAKIIEKEAPFVKAWCEFMNDPKPGGPFEVLGDVTDTLGPLFKKEIAIAFLPWAAANLEAALSRQDVVEVTLNKDEVSHTPLKSAARSFKDTRRKFALESENEALQAFLSGVKADEWLRRPERPARPEGGRDEDGRGRNGRRRRRGGRNRGGENDNAPTAVAATAVTADGVADQAAPESTAPETAPEVTVEAVVETAPEKPEKVVTPEAAAPDAAPGSTPESKPDTASE